jgi:hypothetical protein
MEWSRISPVRVSKLKTRHEANLIRVPKVEAQSKSSSSLVRSPGAMHNKTDAQVAYKVGFGHYLYGLNHNLASNGTDLMAKCLLSQRESSKQVDIKNLPRCCVASLLGLRPRLWAYHPRSPPTLGRPSSYTQYRHLRNLIFVLHLALATPDHAQIRVDLCDSELHLRVKLRLLAQILVCSSIANMN